MKTYIGVKIIKAEPMIRDCVENKYGVICGGDHHGAGYLVDYQNGYKSWFPKDVFEEAYRLTTGLTYGLAYEAMKKGMHVIRKGWNGEGIFVALQTPDENSFMSDPYTYINTTGLQTDNPHAPKCRVPWLPSQTDQAACDWMIVD